MRANLWGLTLPGLELIPGGARGPAQDRMLTYLFNRYTRESQARGIRTYAGYRYTHWWMSWPDARATGQSIQDYVDDCKRIQDGGVPYICHMGRSKDFDPRDADPTLDAPLMEALLKAKVIAHWSPWWEASLAEDPEAFHQTIDHDAAILVPEGVIVGIHLQEGYADFGPDGAGHAQTFWNRCIAVGVKRLYYQYRSDVDAQQGPWSAGMMQARGNDVSVRLVAGGLWGLPESVEWDVFEQCGVELFNNLVDGDGRLATEDTADLKGLEGLCTPGPLPPSGFGNGARYPDGAPI